MHRDVSPKVRAVNNWVAELNGPNDISDRWSKLLTEHWRLPNLSPGALSAGTSLADFADAELQKVCISAADEESLLQRHEEYICGEMGLKSPREHRDPFSRGPQDRYNQRDLRQNEEDPPTTKSGWKVPKRWHAPAR